MFPYLYEVARDQFLAHGYWALFFTLLLENAGIPLPGETMLLFAAFLAHQHHELSLRLIVLTGIAACTLGDNLGYWSGYHGGRPLLDRYQKFFRVSGRKIRRGEALFDRYGAITVFWARFIFGMRVIAGPLAGVLQMKWRKFVLYNFLGAGLWVSVISTVGFVFGKNWDRLLGILRGANELLLVAAVVTGLYLWRRYRKGTGDKGPR